MGISPPTHNYERLLGANICTCVFFSKRVLRGVVELEHQGNTPFVGFVL